jgi:hypothetical protein
VGNWPTWEESRRRRERAITLRKQGLSYKQILAIVGGSSSSLSLRLRDIPLTDLQKAGLRRRKQDAVERTARRLYENRLAREQVIKAEASREIGAVGKRDLFLAGIVAHAAEGSKNKPWGRARAVQFINSDPTMIKLFLCWLDAIGVERTLTFRLSIHERADVVAALAFWAGLVGESQDRFQRTTLKRHNPKTPRRNVGSAYRGCLIVHVRRSTDLNRRIEGWFQALVNHVEERSPVMPTTDAAILVRSGVV